MCKKKIKICMVSFILLAAIAGSMVPLIDYSYPVNQAIKKLLVLAEYSMTYDLWKDIPLPIFLQFYIFNVENPEEVMNGSKPILTQTGPYTYRERRLKVNITWNQNGTISYRQIRKYTFDPEMSAGNETDLITTINPVVALIAQKMKWMPSDIKKYFSNLLNVTNEEMFMTRPVKELLWGYDDPALIRIKFLRRFFLDKTFIGYYTQRNYSDDGVYTIYTGATDIQLLGLITRYNGQSALDIWSTPWANMINGTDGLWSPPANPNKQEVSMFNSDICRSERFYYTKKVTICQNINLRRFEYKKFDFLNAVHNRDNLGFCVPQTHCLPSGLLNVTNCPRSGNGFSMPVIESLPHFLYATPKTIDSVVGLNPNEAEHTSYVDIEPWTGFFLQTSKKLQINIFTEQVSDFKQTDGIKTSYFPIFWLNEKTAINEIHAGMLTESLFTPIEKAEKLKEKLLMIKYLLMSLSSFLILLTVAVWVLDSFICHHGKKDNIHHEDPSTPCLKTSSITYNKVKVLSDGYQRLTT
ncbi:lysosome membrane protein 2-like [Biomphalaria glabrata]|uniref:Lysosome membrane protein 2-like n=1 Tax=Biomphalaria glabrata TaxID=6526 RepID=A0A9W3AWW5_BIOGL|nr:lysosome membrane protein 2-like [Biomphalaria glabrata]